MIAIPCQIEHIAEIRVVGAPHKLGEFVDHEDALHDHARTLIDKDRVMACFGVAPIDKYSGQAWALLSAGILNEFPMYLSKSVKHWLRFIERRDSLRRSQALVDVDHDAAHRWIQWLGFEYEKTLYDSGLGGYGDICLYARKN